MNKKILVAEDNEINYLRIETILKKDDVELLWAKNGEEAVNIYKKNLDINIILMDIKMPIMDGTAAAKIIKQINPNVPIIGITAYQGEMRDETNLNACLEKPFLTKELILIIDKHVKNLCDEMLKKEDKRADEWIKNEKEALRVLTNVSEILELTEYVSKSESTKVLIKLDEIRNILKKKNNNENNFLDIILPNIK